MTMDSNPAWCVWREDEKAVWRRSGYSTSILEVGEMLINPKYDWSTKPAVWLVQLFQVLRLETDAELDARMATED